MRTAYSILVRRTPNRHLERIWSAASWRGVIQWFEQNKAEIEKEDYIEITVRLVPNEA